MRRALIVYASRHGATAGIAERIGEKLRTADIDAVVAPAKEEPDPTDFDAYVVGATF
jgi:menaquinone-dependent protoporphyrinogen oxidase